MSIFEAENPIKYSASSPYTILLFQLVFILVVSRILHLPLSLLKQPRVISEVLTGIILGPTAFGRIPNFTNICFPSESLVGLSVLGNFGIILFLFALGLEVDVGQVKKNYRTTIGVSLLNLAIPFATGCGIAYPLFQNFGAEDGSEAMADFPVFMTFIAVAMSITAFPVLVRILKDLDILSDPVGIITLSAGVINDLVGWILLALVITLANASNSVNTVYILLLVFGWFLLAIFPIRLAVRYILRRFTNDLTSGRPSDFLLFFIFVLVFISSFFTDIISVHPIFGAFIIGVIIPRDNGFSMRFIHMMESIVHVICIPVYFALAGLDVNLGLLSSGKDWGYTIAVIVLSIVSKMVGGFLGSLICKVPWREGLTIGILMSCKGIVEIVVLNVGMQTNVITRKIYSMFIVMALVSTFITAPLAKLSYLQAYRRKRDIGNEPEASVDQTVKEEVSPGITQGEKS